ncbi:hypothetical protein V8C34DRAFT_136527 [Trichoderma compactum]
MDSPHALPPRKSCDRCYKQKARCLPGPKKINMNNGDKGNRGSCLRCLQSGSDCFYSPQRKSGRPPLSQPTTVLTAAALPESAAKTSSAFTPSSLSSLAPMSDDFFSIGESDISQSLPTWLVEGNDPSRHPSVDAISSAGERPCSCVPREFRIDENYLPNDLKQMSSAPFSAATVFPESSYSALPKLSAPSEVRSETAHSHHSASTSSVANERQQASDLRNPMDTLVQELAELNLRICRLTYSASIWSSESLPSVNSPIINELFSITNSLVFLLKQADGIKDFGSGRPWIETSTARKLKHSVLLEDGIALMVLSCHQQILAAFDRLYSSIHQYQAVAKPSFSQPKFRSFNSLSPSPGPDSLEFSSTAQSIMIVNLLDHLIFCLDSAIAPIAHFDNIAPPWDGAREEASDERAPTQDVAGHMGPAGPPTPLPSCAATPVAGEGAIADAVSSISRAPTTQGSPSYADITMVGAILDAMKCRRTRIEEHKRQLKVLLRSSINL